MTIHFVIDSACDVPEDIARQYDMTVLPTFVNYGGESFADGEEFDRWGYYEQLAEMDDLPTTSAPSPGLAKARIEAAFADADHLVLLSMASALSSVYNIMRLGTASLPPERYTLIDSQQISLGAGFQAIAGAEAAANGGDLDAVLAAIRGVQARQALYAGMQSLEYVRRGGRVNWAVGAVGGLLRIRPIVEVECGEVNSAARVRKHSAWITKLADLTRRHAPLARCALLHTHNLTDLTTLREQLVDVLPADTLTVMATPTIGTHTGPGAIGVALVRA